MATESTYIHLTENYLIGYVGSTITTQVVFTRTPSISTPILAIQGPNGTGYEISPDPTNSGKLSYRYNLVSTANTILNFDNTGNANVTVQNVYVGDIGGTSAVSIVPQGSGDGFISLNTDTGSTRIAAYVDSASKQGLIEFFDAAATVGTEIGYSSIATKNIIGSTLSSVDAYIQNLNVSTGVFSTLAARSALVSTLTYNTIVGPQILQIQTIAF
jgi:hypothetical protein